jgi:hypothetical protein
MDVMRCLDEIPSTISPDRILLVVTDVATYVFLALLPPTGLWW